jgi:ABC-2 type transport system ATP-binding protein
MDELLKIKGLHKTYGDFSLKDINLRVLQGCVVGLIGKNGAGKTTTIRSALGIVVSDSGEVSIVGQPPTASSKQDIGIVFDSCSFPDELTVRDVAQMMEAAYVRWDSDAFFKKMEEFLVPLDRKMKELSRGMGMKLMLAIALSHQAKLLILDEATAGLDPIARDEILDVLRDYMQDPNCGILMSTHITSDLEKIADYIVCIEDGRVLFSCEKDVITELAGIAHCRKDQFEELINNNGLKAGVTRFSPHEYGVDLLVADRLSFAKRFPEIVIERASIDEYMRLTLKGDLL